MNKRYAKVIRRTKETDIQIELNLDGKGIYDISTQIPFFDHILTQVAIHGNFDLKINAKGDLSVGSHHTIEDVAICLGQAFSKALGSKKGINRIGSNFFPMDESLAHVVLDISDRPYWVIQIPWKGEYVGSLIPAPLPVSIIEHFFQSLALNAKITLHIKVHYGRDNHHMAESVFKAFSRSMDIATRYNLKNSTSVPSSKGIL